MDDAVQRVLRLVSEGRLTADEAGPILDALAGPRRDPSANTADSRSGFGAGFGAGFGEGFVDGFADSPGSGSGAAAGSGFRASSTAGAPRFARIEVRDGGKRVVDLRIPISLGRFALGRVPGLSAQHIADVEDAVASGDRGPILDVDDGDGSGVRIVLE